MDFSERLKKKKKTVNGSDILSINLFEYLDGIMWPCGHSRSWQTLANYVGKKVPLIILFYALLSGNPVTPSHLCFHIIHPYMTGFS
jgi:hypothetical protein